MRICILPEDQDLTLRFPPNQQFPNSNCLNSTEASPSHLQSRLSPWQISRDVHDELGKGKELRGRWWWDMLVVISWRWEVGVALAFNINWDVPYCTTGCPQFMSHLSESHSASGISGGVKYVGQKHTKTYVNLGIISTSAMLLNLTNLFFWNFPHFPQLVTKKNK